MAHVVLLQRLLPALVIGLLPFARRFIVFAEDILLGNSLVLVEIFNTNSRQLCNYETDPCLDHKYVCLLHTVSLERCNCLRFELLLFLLITCANGTLFIFTTVSYDIYVDFLSLLVVWHGDGECKSLKAGKSIEALMFLLHLRGYKNY